VSRIISKFYKNFYEIFGRIGLEAKNNQLDFGVNYILAILCIPGYYLTTLMTFTISVSETIRKPPLVKA